MEETSIISQVGQYNIVFFCIYLSCLNKSKLTFLKKIKIATKYLYSMLEHAAGHGYFLNER